jgi:hypothetical protein
MVAVQAARVDPVEHDVAMLRQPPHAPAAI